MYTWLVQTLKNDAAVAALIGAKIYPQVAAQGASAPYVTYNIVSAIPVACKEATTQDEVRIQLSAFSPDYIQLQNIYAAIRNALDGHKSDGISCDFVNAVDLYEESDLLRHKAIDFKLSTQI